MPEKQLKGIRGWLIILILNLFLILTFNFVSIIGLINFEGTFILIVLSLIMIFLSGFTLYLIFTKQESAPKFAIMAFLFDILIALLYSYCSANLSYEIYPYPIVNPLMSAIIWTIYILKSKRVKNTFVN